MKKDVPLAHAGMAAQFDLQKQYYAEGKVFILQIESTLQCPQLCNYCYTGSTPGSPQELSSATIRHLLDAAAASKVQMIDWLGGDPLMRKDWEALCAYATSLGLINNIWTSGIPLAKPEVAASAVKATQGGFISTHLDSLNPELYGILHGGEKRHGDSRNIGLILKGINNCLAAGKDPGGMVNCITYTTPLATGDARATIAYFQEKFGIKTCVTLFNPVINRLGNSSWEPTDVQIKDIFDFRDRINYPNDPSCGPMDVSKFYCGTLACVTAGGWVVPCSVIRTEEFGNVNNEEFLTILERGRRRLLFLDFRDPAKLPGNCSSCYNNSVCFGCRSSAYYYAGDLMAADPKCFQYTECSTKKNGLIHKEVRESMNKHYDFSVDDVSAVYAGPGGKLWELLMGEEIHVGGSEQTDYLAKKVGIDRRGKDLILLDICSALGGPARHLVEKYGIRVVGVDTTPEMIAEAQKRTIGKPFKDKIEYRYGSALDLPAHAESFDVVWGQDSWCYVTDKKRLIDETVRVLKSGGTLAFTDWIWGSVQAPPKEADVLMEFMVFPDLQTLDGYANLIRAAGLKLKEQEDLSVDFAQKMDQYLITLKKNKESIIAGFGNDLYNEAEKGILAWNKAAHENKVGRGLWIATKT